MTNQRTTLADLLKYITVSAVLIACYPVTLSAQRARTGTIRITDIEIEQVESPKYDIQGRGVSVGGKKLQWLKITIEYESRGGEDGWIDELTLDWNILMLNGRRPRLLMQKSVSYIDIWEDEKEHYAVVYVRPRTILRHYNKKGKVKDRDLLIHLEAHVGERMVAEYNFSKGRAKKVPERWWTFSTPQVNPLDDALLSRLETPFAPLGYDRYECIKNETR
ncbi:MAG: Amuc_1102 family pilus-like protein [Lentisphaeria bacterium]